MCPFDQEIEKIKNQIIEKYNPKDIILFGSCAKGLVTLNSDIDICIIKNVKDKRKFVAQLLLELEYGIDLEIVVYSEDEWLKDKDDKATFANIINRTGVSLIG